MKTDFTSLGLSGDFDTVLAQIGYTTPTLIQLKSIPILLEGDDLLATAQTGTGKTAAFGLPLIQLLHEIRPAQPKSPNALILAPTRELALQIFQELENFSRHTQLRLACVFGGVGQNPQVRSLAKGVDILIATPGRLLDLIEQKHLSLGQVKKLVLDEADRLMDMGFIRDVRKIVAMTPPKRQSLLFSATMPKDVRGLAQDILRKPREVNIAPKQVTVEKITQRVISVENINKKDVLRQLLSEAAVNKAIVFTRTKHGADKLAKKLNKEGVNAEAIHGNKSQNARVRALNNFTDGNAWVLVATDVAARGIDIEGVSHVYNYELPHEPESYVHRIGRTGRAGSSGMAISLVDPSEIKRLKAVERLVGFKLQSMAADLEFAPSEKSAQVANGQSSNNPEHRPSRQADGGQNTSADDRPKRRRRRRRKPAAATSVAG